MNRLALWLCLAFCAVGCIRVPVPPVPVPTPEVDPIPAPVGSLHVLIWRETDMSRIPEGQLQQFYGPALTDWLKANADYRIWDVGTPVERSETPEWRKAAERRPDPEKLPWIVVSNGKNAFEGPLPPTAAETIALLEKHRK